MHKTKFFNLRPTVIYGSHLVVTLMAFDISRGHFGGTLFSKYHLLQMQLHGVDLWRYGRNPYRHLGLVASLLTIWFARGLTLLTLGFLLTWVLFFAVTAQTGYSASGHTSYSNNHHGPGQHPVGGIVPPLVLPTASAPYNSAPIPGETACT